MYLEFQPKPPPNPFAKVASSRELSVLDLSGSGSILETGSIPPPSAFVKTLGGTPGNIDLGSSNNNYLNDGWTQHPGLVDNSNPDIEVAPFCSYVHQTPILETVVLEKLASQSHNERTPPPASQISPCAEGDVIVKESQKMADSELREESQEFADQSIKRKKYCIDDCQDIQEKRLKIDLTEEVMDEIEASNNILLANNLIHLTDEVIPPTIEIVLNNTTAPSLAPANNRTDTDSLGFVESVTFVEDLNLERGGDSQVPENGIALQSKISEFLLSESQDLAFKGHSVVDNSISSCSVSDVESVSKIVEEQPPIPTTKEINLMAVIAMAAHTSTSSSTVVVGSSLLKGKPPRKPVRKSSSVSSSATKKKIASYSSSTEPDNPDDDDYHPTQRSLIPFVAGLAVKKGSSTGRKIGSSSKCNSSELGSIPSVRKKVKFQIKENGIFSKLRIAITISTNSIEENNPEAETWMYDKVKLARKITTHGGTIVKDLMKSFNPKNRQIIKNTILLTLAPLRTKKFLLALSLGIPVVSVTWLAYCLKQRIYCDYNSFRLPNGDSILLKQPCAAPPSDCGIFKGKSFHIYAGPSEKKDSTIKDWTQILGACEANIVGGNTLKKNLANFVLILVSEVSLKEMEVYGDRLVSTEFVIQCLRHQSILPRDGHPSFTSLK